MRSTAENENYKDRDGPPNAFSHRRAQNLLLSIIARLCATKPDLWPLRGAFEFPGGGCGIPTGRTGRGAGRGCAPLSQEFFQLKGYKEKYFANFCVVTLGQKQ